MQFRFGIQMNRRHNDTHTQNAGHADSGIKSGRVKRIHLKKAHPRHKIAFALRQLRLRGIYGHRRGKQQKQQSAQKKISLLLPDVRRQLLYTRSDQNRHDIILIPAERDTVIAVRDHIIDRADDDLRHNRQCHKQTGQSAVSVRHCRHADAAPKTSCSSMPRLSEKRQQPPPSETISRYSQIQDLTSKSGGKRCPSCLWENILYFLQLPFIGVDLIQFPVKIMIQVCRYLPLQQFRSQQYSHRHGQDQKRLFIIFSLPYRSKKKQSCTYRQRSYSPHMYHIQEKIHCKNQKQFSGSRLSQIVSNQQDQQKISAHKHGLRHRRLRIEQHRRIQHRYAGADLHSLISCSVRPVLPLRFAHKKLLLHPLNPEQQHIRKTEQHKIQRHRSPVCRYRIFAKHKNRKQENTVTIGIEWSQRYHLRPIAACRFGSVCPIAELVRKYGESINLSYTELKKTKQQQHKKHRISVPVHKLPKHHPHSPLHKQYEKNHVAIIFLICFVYNKTIKCGHNYFITIA